jgi:hypothetical protein
MATQPKTRSILLTPDQHTNATHHIVTWPNEIFTEAIPAAQDKAEGPNAMGIRSPSTGTTSRPPGLTVTQGTDRPAATNKPHFVPDGWTWTRAVPSSSGRSRKDDRTGQSASENKS